MTEVEKKRILKSEFVKELKDTADFYGYTTWAPFWERYPDGTKFLRVQFSTDSDHFNISLAKSELFKNPEKIEFEIGTSSWGYLKGKKLELYKKNFEAACTFKNYLEHLDWEQAPICEVEEKNA